MSLRIAALQLRSSAQRLDVLSRASSLVSKAVCDHGAKLVVLPEAFTGLYGVQHFASNAELWKAKDSGTEMMSRLAKEHGIYVCGGVIEQHPIRKDTFFNTVAAFGPDGMEAARYRKMHLSKVQVGPDKTSEGSVLTAGDDLGWFDIHEGSDDGRGWRVGLACCFDLRFKELSDLLTSAPPAGVGCDVLLYPSCWLKSTGEMGHWDTLLKARALDGQCYVMGVSTARDDDQDVVAFGHSQIIGPLGETLSVCSDDSADEVVIAELSMSKMIDVRQRMIPFATVKRPAAYQHALRSAQEVPAAMMRPPTGA